MKFVLSLLGFVVILALIAAFYQAGAGSTTFLFFLLVAGAVYVFLLR